MGLKESLTKTDYLALCFNWYGAFCGDMKKEFLNKV